MRKYFKLNTPRVARGEHPNYAERRRSSEKITVPHVSYHNIHSHLPSLWILTD